MKPPSNDEIVTLDFETYYDKEYSLTAKGMNMSEYVRDDRFHIHCVGIKIGDQPTRVYNSEEAADAIRAIPWSTSYLLCHNTSFDGFILSHHFGIVPRGYLDTQSMSRGFWGLSFRHSLDALAQRCGIGQKSKQALEDVKGMMEIPPELYEPFAEYCGHDVDLTKKCFDFMFKYFPDKELALIDQTIRMFCDPVLLIDVQRAHDEYAKECGKKVAALFKAGAMTEDLLSNQRFAELLKSRGVDAPLKISKTTGKATFAFAKGDAAFQALAVEHPHVKDLVDARLAVKSTIGETRAHRFVEAGKDGMRLPVLLNYCGAHTHRWSGGNKLNLQNLPRGGELRKSILAPSGYRIIVADSAQIEARTVAWLAGQDDLVKLFASGEDVYKYMASRIYGVPTSQVTKDQRFIGKTCVLGLGFGMGARKLQTQLAAGTMGPKVDMSLDECYRIVEIYRNANKAIVALWAMMGEWIDFMQLKGVDQPFPGKNDVLRCKHNMILGPNGLPLVYTDLGPKPVKEQPPDSWFDDTDLGVITYQTIKGRAYIYGGLLTENVVQHIARCIVADQMLTIGERYRVVMMTHDEVVAVAPEKEADEALAFMLDTMKTVPSWAKGLPLNAEGGHDVCYSK